MLWEVEIQPKGRDIEKHRVSGEYDLLTRSNNGASLVHKATRGYLLEGDIERPAVERLIHELLLDPICETSFITPLPEPDRKSTRLNSSHSRASRMPSSA